MQPITYDDLLALLGIGGAHPGGLKMTKEILSVHNLNKGSKVLDAGCGTGQTAAYLAKHYDCEVTALDNHPLMVDKAKQRFQNEQLDIKLYQGDIMKLPFEDSYFDLIIAESVTVFSDIAQALSEYVRVLRPKGELLNLDMTLEHSFPTKELNAFRSFYKIKHIPSEEEWSKLFKQAGFATVEVLKGETVASLLKATQAARQGGEFSPSESIPMEVYDTLFKHQDLTERYANQIGYRYFRCKKGGTIR